LIGAGVFMSVASAVYAEGLGTLIEVAKSQKEMQRSYDEETKVFERVQSAVERGEIKKGDSKDDILRKYGEPVVILQDKEKGGEKWVYKPASSTFFEGVRVKIFFDSRGAVDEIVKEGA
jgi:hypothetical protein